MSSLLRLPNNYHTYPDSLLLGLKVSMEQRKDDIKEKLAHIKAKGSADQDASLADWCFRARKADRLYGRDIQLIQLELSRRKERRRKRQSGMGDRFVAAARRMLSEQMFAEIMRSAVTEGGANNA